MIDERTSQQCLNRNAHGPKRRESSRSMQPSNRLAKPVPSFGFSKRPKGMPSACSQPHCRKTQALQADSRQVANVTQDRLLELGEKQLLYIERQTIALKPAYCRATWSSISNMGSTGSGCHVHMLTLQLCILLSALVSPLPQQQVSLETNHKCQLSARPQ